MIIKNKNKNITMILRNNYYKNLNVIVVVDILYKENYNITKQKNILHTLQLRTT